MKESTNEKMNEQTTEISDQPIEKAEVLSADPSPEEIPEPSAEGSPEAAAEQTTEEPAEAAEEQDTAESSEQAAEESSEESAEESADPSETEELAQPTKREVDYAYIAENIANLSHMYIRVYRDGEPIAIEDPIQFPMDPATPYLQQLFQIDQKASYFVTPYDQFYGILCYDSVRIILGPTFHMPPSRRKIREFMFQLGVKRDYFFSYQDLLAGVTPMPLELFLHELCLIYYFISEEKLYLSDFALYDATSNIIEQNQLVKRYEAQDAPAPAPLNPVTFGNDIQHTTIGFEQQMLTFIRNGDPDGLKNYIDSHPAGQPGKTSSSYLRQLQNIFIATVTLCSRAAIEGGLPSEEALSLSDRYIQHSEKFEHPEQIINLQYHMIMDYATLVAQLAVGGEYNYFLRTITSYIREHLDERLTVDQIAEALHMNRSYLSTKFKRETGRSLSSYVIDTKLKKSMEYLRNTDKPIIEIVNLLGFSSQGYFQNVFKRHIGITPGQYRERD